MAVYGSSGYNKKLNLNIMELALFHKDNTKLLYKQVDKILEDSGFNAKLGFIPNDKKRQATLLALQNMNKENHFNICTVNNIFKLHNIKPSPERKEFLDLFHCMDWGEMDEDMRTFINALIFKELEEKINV